MKQKGHPKTSTHSWLCLVAAGPFVIAALAGREYGGSLPFAVIALVAIAQAIRPTRPGYAVVLFTTASAALLLTYLLASDLAALAYRRSPRILVDGDDTALFVILWALACALVIGIYRTRPVREKHVAESAT